MKRVVLLGALVNAGTVWSPIAASLYLIQAFYSGAACDGTPYLVNANESPDCANEACTADGVAVGTISTECTSDYLSALRNKFGSFPYILEVYSPASDCSTFSAASAFLASGNCEGSFNVNESMGVHFVTRFESNGSASVQYFSGSPCLSEQWITMEQVDKKTLGDHSCDASGYTWYSSNDVILDDGVSVTSIVGISVACLVGLVLVGFLFFRKSQSRKLLTQRSLPLTTVILQSDETILPEIVSADRSALWNDDAIVANRIQRNRVKIKKLISRGAYGEVYLGKFNRKPVAVKMLITATRGSIQQVNDLLSEAKMIASMDHPHILSFIGVAWDSLSDLCVVLEYMDGGDLRLLLDEFLKAGQPVGINKMKATIALHVCHALTYLHSLNPPIVHRDLKSRNILLNRSMAAKLTDFGISRERPDNTMTAGVGTSLWMAPEVMLGKKYNLKADMFSFGVVLSELDLHTMPYAHAMPGIDADGNHMTGAALLQKITTGEEHIKFSVKTPEAIAELGRACTSIHPDDRPSAAEALYKLHVFLAQK
ncbi:TKL protein kinase [Phytophthora nicotianae]|uniref:TKL protein kinase n=1 Tax=Phytophthora nicotianae TaxID=4792 RepID=W2NPB5_PHYNI|nr:TKL protein kinase [Phytophthora nicotianae]